MQKKVRRLAWTFIWMAAVIIVPVVISVLAEKTFLAMRLLLVLAAFDVMGFLLAIVAEALPNKQKN